MENGIGTYDYVIVGAGLWGSTFAYLATQKGKKCLVLEKEPFIGGGLYCKEEHGINVHMFGPHVFHTDNEDIWNFVNGIVKFNSFINQPVAKYNGEIYNLPFNMNTFVKVFNIKSPKQAQDIIKKEIKEYQETNGKDIINLKDQAINLVGTTIYKTLIEGYTEKQWGRKCEELSSDIIKRLPLRFTYNNNYFNDRYQGVPIGGYNKLIEGLLVGCDVRTNIDFLKDKKHWESLGDKVVYTGMIDELYDYCFGELEYRSLRFEYETIHHSNYQGNAIVNYTNKEIPFTRIIEHKHFEYDNPYSTDYTIISKEYPKEWKKGDRGYYPINDAKNNSIYEKYVNLSKFDKNYIFGGRLAEYKYYDMDDTIASVFKIIDKI